MQSSFSKWCLIVAPSRNGLEMILKGSLLNLQTSKFSLDTGFWISFSHRILVTSRSASWSPTCKNAFLISETSPIFSILNLNNNPHKSSKITDPLYKHSLRLLALRFILADALYTILIFVVVFSGVITGWWGI